MKPATFGFDLVSAADPFLKVERHCNSKLTHLPPSKGEKMLWSVLQPTAHHLCRNAGRVQTWLIFANSELFWHVYLFNLFILTSSDYNWQQCVALTLDSVLDLSITIMEKECEGKSTHCITMAGMQENYKRFLPQKETQPQFSTLFKNLHDCANDTWTLIISFIQWICPSAKILVQQLLNVEFKII